jgi:hypothetical protein
MDRSSIRQDEKFLLWIDAVGGYWVCLGNEVILGQAGPIGQADVTILGDLSGQHARIRRDAGGYVIEAIREVWVDGRPAEPLAPLCDGSTIVLGRSVRLVFRRPHPLSMTARLDFLSHHRTQPSSDAVILMADACILGSKPQCHVVCRELAHEVVLFRQEDRLLCRVSGPLDIDGVACSGPTQLRLDSHLRGDHFALGLEPLAQTPP